MSKSNIRATIGQRAQPKGKPIEKNLKGNAETEMCPLQNKATQWEHFKGKPRAIKGEPMKRSTNKGARLKIIQRGVGGRKETRCKQKQTVGNDSKGAPRKTNGDQ